MKLVLKLTTFFSKAEDVLMTKLLVKVPKEVEIDVSPGFLSLFFDRTKKYPFNKIDQRATCCRRSYLRTYRTAPCWPSSSPSSRATNASNRTG